MINSGARAAYRAGWLASKRTTTYDLDAAQQRFERTHGTTHSSAFIDGWIDFASDAEFDAPQGGTTND